jgi:hypothetical protein
LSQAAREAHSCSDGICDEEVNVHVTNARVADRALKVAEWSDGLQRQAAMCVVLAASTARRPRQARKALKVIPHPDLRAAAMLLLADLAAARPAAAATLRWRVATSAARR